MLKKLLFKTATIALAAAMLLPCASAASLDKKFSPEKYINISGNYSAESAPGANGANEALYKFILAEGQTVLVDVTPAEGTCASIRIANDEDITCATASAELCDANGRILCAYTAKTPGEYYAFAASNSEAAFNVSISFPAAATQPVEQFPYSSYFQQELSEAKYLTYSFKLRSGDAFSLNTEGNYAYILFDGNANESAGTPTKLYNNSFYGFCGIVADSCVATVFVPLPCSGTISADILSHGEYIIEDIVLPVKNEPLNLSNAAAPFDEELLKTFTADFGEDAIDNSPLKYFRFHQQPNQIIQISASTDVMAACKLVSGLDSTSPYSGGSRMMLLHDYEGKNGKATRNLLTKSTGNYMLAVRDLGDGKADLAIQSFEALSLVKAYASTYEYGDPIDSLEIKNIFVDTNIKDLDGKLVLPEISAIKLIDDAGNRLYYSMGESLQPEAGHSYSVYAVVSHGDITYQVNVGGFSVEKAESPSVEPEEPVEEDEPRGLAWWMIALIAIAGFCLACCIFLLVYKKDINEVE